MAIDNAADKVDGAMAQCLVECDAGDFGCVEVCVAGKLNISLPCSTCYGMYAACAFTECKNPCKDFAGGECQSCLEKKGCKFQLNDCTGGKPVGLPEPGEGAACTPEDMMVFGALGVQMKEIISACWDECKGDDSPNCVAKCLATSTDLSNECTKCQGATYTCVYDLCGNECSKDLDALECGSCMDDSGCMETNCFGAP